MATPKVLFASFFFQEKGYTSQQFFNLMLLETSTLFH